MTKDTHHAYVCRQHNWDLCVPCIQADLFIDSVKEPENVNDDYKITPLDAARQLVSKLSLKLLFDLVRAEDILSNKDTRMQMLSKLISYFGESADEIQNGVHGGMWDCQFRPQISDTAVDVYEGIDANIHRVLQCVQFPTVDTIRDRLTATISKLNESNDGRSLMERWLKNYVDGFFE
jgi:hypothetical protein